MGVDVDNGNAHKICRNRLPIFGPRTTNTISRANYPCNYFYVTQPISPQYDLNITDRQKDNISEAIQYWVGRPVTVNS